MSKKPLSGKNSLLFMTSLLLGGVLILALDFLFGNLILPPALKSQERPFLEMELGWYNLKPDYSGFDQFGSNIYAVSTDENGFRKDTDLPSREDNDIIFLGDSFTYGVNGTWKETFVGMFADTSEKAIINAGVSSYSPTAYVYQYKKALSASLLKTPHTVVVGIDIGDVQDEAGLWIDGDQNPRKRDEELSYRLKAAQRSQQSKEAGKASGLRMFVAKNLPLTRAVFRYFRGSQSGFARSGGSVYDRPRSAFTHADWAPLDQQLAYKQEAGYAPLGVRGGLDRIELKLGEITEIAGQNGANVYFLIYPWPAQLRYTEDKFDWSAFVQDICTRLSCSGVVDTIPRFRRLAAENQNWYRTYFIDGDVHFNEAGNRIISEELLKALQTE